MTYFLKWHLSPKRDLNLGLKRQSTWIREISVLDHSATTAGLRYQRLCQEDTYFFRLEIIFLGKLYVSNKVGPNNIFSASYFFSRRSKHLKKIVGKKIRKIQRSWGVSISKFLLRSQPQEIGRTAAKVFFNRKYALEWGVMKRAACFLEFRLRLRWGSK